MKRVKKKAALAALVCGVLGVSLIALGLYLAPSEAYELQAPFRQFGESTTGIVVSTGTSTRAYVAGGRRGGAREYEENVVTLQLPSEGGRTVQIAHLVLDADMERLVPGASVAVTFVRGEGARQLRQGPYYLLTSSVEASPIGLLGWAFDGRPSRGRAIAG